MAAQARVVYSGTVQGVGFRWTVCNIAIRFDVTGWVCNRPDRTVELVAEGDVAEVEEFLAAVRSRMGDFIRDEKIQDAPASGRFTVFEVRH